VALDKDILAAPTQLLAKAPGVVSELPNPSPTLLQLLPLETAGACAVTVIVDAVTDKLYVANIGDCRAVAGWQNPVTGEWRCDVLTDIGDTVAENPLESAR
jgi:pyruvate dehydrogenase phosphatase